MKRTFIIYGWGGYPGENWFPWLKKELELKGFQVLIPEMPNPDHPRIQGWVEAITKAVGEANEDVYFVGHSVGCQAIARYLETLPGNIKIGGAIFVAGFFKGLSKDDIDFSEAEQYWIKEPIDFEKIKKHLEKSVAIFSDDDPYVPLYNQDDFKSKLGSKIIIENGKSHFNIAAGILELPVVRDEILKMAQ